MSQLKEVQAAMGAIVFSFQQLEYELIEVLYSLIDPPTLELIKVLQPKFEFDRSMKLLLAVAQRRIAPKEMCKELEFIVQKASKFAKERNLLLHSHYHVTDSSQKYLAIKRSGTRLRSGSDERVGLIPENLILLSEEMNQTIREVETYHEDLLHYLHYDPEDEESYHPDNYAMSKDELDALFRNIGDLGNVETGGLFLLGKRAE
jgi:hypothetical protein